MKKSEEDENDVVRFRADPAETSSGAAACTLASGLWVLGLDPVSYLG